MTLDLLRRVRDTLHAYIGDGGLVAELDAALAEPANCWSEGQSHDFIGGKCIRCGALESPAGMPEEAQRYSEGQPSGYVSVPREATPEMCEAYYELCRQQDTLAVAASEIWRAMLAASGQPQEPER